MKEKILNKLLEYRPTNTDVEIKTYDGYSLIHIDIIYKEQPALFTTINISEEEKPLIMKLCSFDEVCTESEKDILLISELENICKYLNIKEIYGRAKILKNKKTSKEFYSNLGYNFDYRPREKKYLSAIISKQI